MTMNTRRSLLASAAAAIASSLLALPSTGLVAQETEAAEQEELEEVIVTGSRTGRALNKIPGAVSVIGQEEIDTNVALTGDITALLARTVPGYGESKQQMDRQGETLRGRNALRLLDGVPQGSPLRDGSRDSIFTEMGIIERVEVINGPSAAEGIGAAGGIINYITRTPKEPGTELRVSTQYRTQFETDSNSWRVAMMGAHKNESFDFLIAGSFAETGIAYDGDGRTIGIGTSGSDRDSQSDNLFLKAGTDFGAGDSQRIEVSHSRFLLECQCRYSLFDEHPEIWDWHNVNQVPMTSIKESPPGAKASFNDFVQTTVSYRHNDIAGGSLYLQAYTAEQAMRFESEQVLGKQNPDFAPFTLDEDGFPVGPLPLVEQSEIDSEKKGLRSSWSTDALMGRDGLGLQAGVDIVEDTAEQRLAVQDSSWVPPMKYTSVAPFAQVSLDVDAWTFTAGLRYEDGELEVDDYVTSWANDRRPVGGGRITYDDLLPNVGAIWRIDDAWSVYASYSEGFSLPNAGIPLRNVSCSNDTSEAGNPSDPVNFPFGGIQPDGCPNDPPISVNDIIDLDAIIVDNVEAGFSWTGTGGNRFGVSLFESTSEFGATLRTDPDLGDLVLAREPTEIRGFELTGAYTVTDDLRLSGLFSHITGKTSSSDPDVLDREMGVFNVSPDKLVVTADWRFSDRGNVILGSTMLLDRDINEGEAGEEHIDGSTLLFLSANHEVGNGVLSLGIDNLLDETYLLATSQVTFWKNYMHGRGREVSIGYTVDF
jgi:iron complex outermembrane receptor protein